jgi:alpha-L-fucosidase
VNGEAIYETRPVAPYREGKLRLTRGRDGAVYAIYLADDTETELPRYLSMTGLQPADGATVSLLGADGTLGWEPAGSGFVAEVPERLRATPPCEYAWVFKITRVE